MNKTDKILYDNYICWKTVVLVFMWQIKIVTYSRKIVRVDELAIILISSGQSPIFCLQI